MSIGFLVPWPLNADLTAYWSMWATIATAAGTFLLAAFALFAWRAALGTIRAQKESDQLAALSDYVRALHAISRHERPGGWVFLKGTPIGAASEPNPIADSRKRLAELSHEVESTGLIWRAHHAAESNLLPPLIEAELILINSQLWWSKSRSTDGRKEQFELWSEFARELSSQVTQWQVRKNQRRWLSKVIESYTEKYRQDSPLSPEAGDNL